MRLQRGNFKVILSFQKKRTRDVEMKVAPMLHRGQEQRGETLDGVSFPLWRPGTQV